jgi:hypothetical protein
VPRTSITGRGAVKPAVLAAARTPPDRLSSGIEGALHVVERYYGSAARSSVADYMEYVSHTWSEA